MKYDLIIIGAGPSGVMAAIKAAEAGKKVCIIDQNNEICKKLKITGGGRCNITSNINIRYFEDKIPQNNKFIRSSLSAFTNKDLINFVEILDVETKVEGEKIYLKSDDSNTLIKALLKLLNRLKVKIVLGEKVTDLIGSSHIVCIKTIDNNSYYANNFILATGGKSYPNLGSDGSILNYLNQNNILPVSTLYPSLVGIKLKECNFSDLAGTSISNVDIKIKKSRRGELSLNGQLLFTHNGLSGPVILNASSYLIDNRDIQCYIDFIPEISKEDLIKLLMQLRDKNAIIQSLSSYLPKKFLKNMIPDLDYKNIKKKIFQDIQNSIKEYIVEIDSFEGYNKAIITRGGVLCDNIDPKTMKSKLHDNLWIVGEMLDVDGLTGGYNLQIAFSTGYVAGKEIGGM